MDGYDENKEGDNENRQLSNAELMHEILMFLLYCVYMIFHISLIILWMVLPILALYWFFKWLF